MFAVVGSGMLPVVGGTGLAVGAVAALYVYSDASRRGLDRARSLALGVGAVSVVAFLVPGALLALAFRGAEGATVARLPESTTAWMLAFGVSTTAALVLLYGIASRMGTTPTGRPMPACEEE